MRETGAFGAGTTATFPTIGRLACCLGAGWSYDAQPGARPHRHHRWRHRLVHDALRAQEGRPNLWAIVAMTDSGGSSRRLMDEFGRPLPLGDLRQALVALSPLPQALGRHLQLPLPRRAGRGRRRALPRQPDPARPRGPERGRSAGRAGGCRGDAQRGGPRRPGDPRAGDAVRRAERRHHHPRRDRDRPARRTARSCRSRAPSSTRRSASCPGRAKPWSGPTEC